MALQQQPGGVQDVLLVVDHQDAGGVECRGVMCSKADRCPVTCTPADTAMPAG